MSHAILVDVRRTLAADPHAVFTLLSDHAAIPTWVPLVTAVRVEPSASVRWVKARGTPESRETIVAWRPPHGYSYRADGDALPFEDHEATIEITPSESGCVVRWTHAGRRRPGIRAEIGVRVTRWICERALGNLDRQLRANR